MSIRKFLNDAVRPSQARAWEIQVPFDEIEFDFDKNGGFDALVHKAISFCAKQIGKLTKADERYISRLVLDKVECSYREHNSPWWSEALKADMKAAKGFFSSQPEVLDEAFSQPEVAEEVTDALRLHDPETVAQMVASCLLLDTRCTGNFSGYSPRLILSSWQRLGIIYKT